MEEQVRFLTEQVQALQAELQHQRQQLQQGVGALPQLAASVEMLARRAARPTGLIDNRGVGKPPTFTNKEDDFLAWSRKTENYVASGLGEEFGGVLRWAQELEEEPTQEALEREFGQAALRPQDLAQLQEWSHQLYAVLLSFTSGESNDLVVGSGEGLRAWRRLARRWDPHTSTTTSKLLRASVAPGRAGFADFSQCMERWQQLVARYEQRRDRNGVRAVISDEIERAALEQLVPENVESHLLLNQHRLDTFDAAWREVKRILEARTGHRIRAPALNGQLGRPGGDTAGDPMDVHSVQKGKGRGGRGSGKGQGSGRQSWNDRSSASSSRGKGAAAPGSTSRFEGTCQYCGEQGHRAAHCWQKARETAPQGGKGGKEQKGGKGKKTKARASTPTPSSRPARPASRTRALWTCPCWT